MATDDQMIDDLIDANDKYEAAIALQPEANPNHISSSYEKFFLKEVMAQEK